MQGQTKKVILAGEPRFLREMLRQVIDKSSGLLVVGEIDNIRDLDERLQRFRVDWIVMALRENGQVPVEVENLITQSFPSVRIMGVSSDGSRVKIAWVGLKDAELEEASVDDLTGILRGGSIDFT